MKTKCRAFTLVELLVVIAIIGILVALLLPAVQAARESGRRAQCQNNLKQIALALQNYHDTRRKLPMGNNGPINGGYGYNWRLHILPYMEQSALHDQFDTKLSSWSNAMAPSNGAVIPGYRCPSSPLPEYAVPMNPQGTVFDRVQRVTYVGISGATAQAFTGSNYVESRQNNAANTTGCCTGGDISAGGALPSNFAVGMHAITDGTSNTIVVSEQADYLQQQNSVKVDWNTGWHGWLIGTSQKGIPGGPGVNSADNRIFGLVSIRYRTNQKKGWPVGGDCKQGVCPNFGCNVPLNSTHPGGVLAAFGDGSVRFLSDSLPLLTLAILATRDEGIAVTTE
jgi:prepilin-type N-terminal cleavage/methylation domain-containing protein